MEVRGRNRKWLGTGIGRTVRVGWVDIVCEFCPRIACVWGGMNTFIVVGVVECGARMGHHEHVGGENGGRSGRGSVNGKKGADSGELVVDLFFLNVEEASNMLNYLFVGES